MNQKYCVEERLRIGYKVFECEIEMPEIKRFVWEPLDFDWRNNGIVESQRIFRFVIVPKNLYIWVYLIKNFYLKYIGFPFLFIITNSIIIYFNPLISHIYWMIEVNFNSLKFIKMIKTVNLMVSMKYTGLQWPLKRWRKWKGKEVF